MEIVKRGIIPSEKIHEFMCSNCKTIFTFKGHEAERKSDQRDGDYFEVSCPVCHKKIFKDAKS